MRLILESTDKVTMINGVPCRIWLGNPEEGQAYEKQHVHCAIAAISVDVDYPDIERFRKDLLTIAKPASSGPAPFG